MSEQLQIIPAQSLAPVVRHDGALTIEQVFQAVTSGDISPEKVAVMKELLAMSAERQFTTAFVALQSDVPVITAKTVIPNRGKYEKFEDIMSVVGPLLRKHGFTVSFSMDFADGRVLETCHLSHVGGHTRINGFAVRTGRKADSDTQADCMAATTAKRNALLNALNIVIRQDCLTSEDDARIEGGPVTLEVAFELERRVAETDSNRVAFLKFACATDFKDILASKYSILNEYLQKKERRGK
jgi:hypothetical protein